MKYLNGYARSILSVIPFFIFLVWLSSCAPAESKYPSIEKLKSRVNIHLANKNFPLVISVCDSIIAVDSSESWGHIRKAVALYHLTKYAESLSVLDRVLLRNDSSFEAYYWRGVLRSTTGDAVGALSDYNKALALDPSSALVLNNRASMYSYLKMNDSALAGFRQAVEADTSFLKARSNLGEMYRQMRLYDSSIICLTRCIAMSATGDHYHERGLTYYESKQFDLAVADFTMALLYDPNNSLTYLHRAYAYAELGNKTQMCEDLSTAWSLGNEEARRYYQSSCHEM